MGRKNKARKALAQTKDQTPLLPLSGTRKVVRTPTNPFEVTDTVELFVPKEIITRRIDAVFQFELLARWVPKEPEAVCSVVTDGSTVAATSLTPKAARVSGDISMSSFLTRNK